MQVIGAVPDDIGAANSLAFSGQYSELREFGRGVLRCYVHFAMMGEICTTVLKERTERITGALEDRPIAENCLIGAELMLKSDCLRGHPEPQRPALASFIISLI